MTEKLVIINGSLHWKMYNSTIKDLVDKLLLYVEYKRK